MATGGGASFLRRCLNPSSFLAAFERARPGRADVTARPRRLPPPASRSLTSSTHAHPGAALPGGTSHLTCVGTVCAARAVRRKDHQLRELRQFLRPQVRSPSLQGPLRPGRSEWSLARALALASRGAISIVGVGGEHRLTQHAAMAGRGKPGSRTRTTSGCGAMRSTRCSSSGSAPSPNCPQDHRPPPAHSWPGRKSKGTLWRFSRRPEGSHLTPLSL